LADKAVVYIKQPNEPLIPVTVRIEWLPNGKIKPILYWTPDDSCYEVKHIYESTLLAFLKEKGVGIRFKVRAELKEIPDDDMVHIQHETYLYFADGRFCERGFIDQRYSHPNKEYVPVIVDVFPNADYELVCFQVGDHRYMVEKTLKVEPRASFQAGGIGIWHKVNVRLVNDDNDEDPNPNKSEHRKAALFWELNKWFVVKSA